MHEIKSSDLKLFSQTQDLHPYIDAYYVSRIYRKLLDQVAESRGISVPDLSRPILISEPERSFISELQVVVLDSKREKNFSKILGFIKFNEKLESILDSKSLNPEFLLLTEVLKEGIQSILQSPSFETEYKPTKESFFDLIYAISTSFLTSNRILFAFHAGEVFGAKEFYDRGKNLGIGNAAVLSLRRLVS